MEPGSTELKSDSLLLLSIIIPAYRAEEYIVRCLESILMSPSMSGLYEIIVVDDGSPDRTAELVEALQPANPSISILRQSNCGVSAARNAGMDAASGLYVLFVDADDYLLPGILERELPAVLASGYEVYSFGIQIMDAVNRVTETIRYSSSKKDFTGVEAYNFTRNRKSSVPDSSVSKLYQLGMLRKHGIRFTPGIAYLEDGEFIARCFCIAQHCGFSDQLLYVRTTRLGSAVNSNLIFRETTLVDFLKVAAQLRDFQRQPGLTETQRNMLNLPIIKYTILPLQITGLRRLNFFISAVRRLTPYHLALGGVIEPYRTLAIQFNLSLYWFWIYSKIRNLKISFVNQLVKLKRSIFTYC